MSIFDKDKIKLQALNYAEKNKIVNQKSIDAYIAGFYMRDNSDSEINLKSVEDIFQRNYNDWEADCGYSDLRNQDYQQRKSEGYEALEIAKDIRSIIEKIKNFNSKNKRKY